MSNESKNILVCGGTGFIGHHLARTLKRQGHFVVVADIKENEYIRTSEFCNEFYHGDLREEETWAHLFVNKEENFDEIYQLAADMGGAGYIFSKENDYDIMSNSALINLHAVNAAYYHSSKIFYSSSACIYPAHNQKDPNNPICSEDSAYPADPDSDYGMEKLFSERLYLAAARNKGLDVRIARFHNIFGPEGTWKGGKEKAPAALCRKVIEAVEPGEVQVWGSGEQTRSFLYIDECIEGIQRLMRSDFIGPVNIGSEEKISINDLVSKIIDISGKRHISIRNIPGFVGVSGRNSDNTLIKEKLGWAPDKPLSIGLRLTYNWIKEQYDRNV